MATRNDEREHLDSERVGIIEEALVKLYQRVKDREIQLSDLTEVLVKDYGERGKGLRQRLFAFTREGQFGMFFDRPNELKAQSSFNVFDLKRLDGYPELQASFLLVTMNFIISSIQSTDPGRPNIFSSTKRGRCSRTKLRPDTLPKRSGPIGNSAALSSRSARR